LEKGAPAFSSGIQGTQEPARSKEIGENTEETGNGKPSE